MILGFRRLALGLAAGLTWITGGALALVLGGCGQSGPLYLPKDPNAAQRATLPRALLNIVRTPKVPQPPASAGSAAVAAASTAASAAAPDTAAPLPPDSSPDDESAPETEDQSAPTLIQPPPALPDIPRPR